jgi:hypothetical protein
VRSMIIAWTGTTQLSFRDMVGFIGAGAGAFNILMQVILRGVDVGGTAIKILATAFKGLFGLIDGFATSAKGIITFDPAAMVSGVNKMKDAWVNFDQTVSTQIRAFGTRGELSFKSISASWNHQYQDGFLAMYDSTAKALGKAKDKFGEFIGGLEGLIKPANNRARDIMGASGAKKGRDETEQVLKEQLGLVNDWLKATGQALAISGTVWKMLPQEIRGTLTGVEKAFHESIDKAQMWSSALQAAFLKISNGEIGKTLIVTLKGMKIDISGAKLGVKPEALTLDINPNLWASLWKKATEGSQEAKNAIKAIQVAMKESGATLHFVIPQIADDLISYADVAKATEAGTKSLTENSKPGITTWGEHWKKVLDGVKGKLTWSDLMAGMMGPPPAPATQFMTDPSKFPLAIALKEAAIKLKGDIQSILGDGVGSIVVSLAEKFQLNLATVKKWSSDVEVAISQMPGKFGAMANGVYSTLNQWAAWANGVLSILHRLNADIPSSLGGIAASIGGLFKSLGSSTPKFNLDNVSKDISDIMQFASKETQTGMSKISDTATKNASKFSGAFSMMGAAMAGFSANMAVTAATGSRLTGAVVGGITGALSGMMSGMAIGAAGGPIGALGGAIIGGGISLLGSLFGHGKSAAQKEQEKLQQQQIRDQAAITAQNVQKGALEVSQTAFKAFQEAKTTLEGMADYTTVPKAAFQAFFKDLGKLMDAFVDMAGRWKDDSLAKAKVLGEAMEPIMQAIGSGVTSLTALGNYSGIAERAINEFGVDTERVINKFAELSDKIEKSFRKQAVKLSEQLKSVIEIVGSGATAFRDLSMFQSVPASAMEQFGVALESAVRIMADIYTKVDSSMTKNAARFAEKGQAVASFLKDGVQGFKDLSTFSGIPSITISAFFVAVEDASVMLAKLAGSMLDEVIAQASTFATKMKSMFEFLSSGTKAFTDLKGVDSRVGTLDLFAQNVNDVISYLLPLLESGNVQGAISGKAEATFEGLSKFFSTVANAVGSLKNIAAYQSFPIGILQAIVSDIAAVVASVDQMVAYVDYGLGQALKFESLAKRMADTIVSGMGYMKGSIVGMNLSSANLSAAGSSITSNLTTGLGASYLPPSAAGGYAGRSGGSAQNINVEVNVQGSLIHQAQLEDVIVEAINNAQRQGKLADPREVISFVNNMFSSTGGLAQTARAS